MELTSQPGSQSVVCLSLSPSRLLQGAPGLHPLGATVAHSRRWPWWTRTLGRRSGRQALGGS